MGNNKEANIYLASPAVVAWSVVNGEITDPRDIKTNDKYPYSIEQSVTVDVSENDDRYLDGVWNNTDVNNLNPDLMFAGNLTYNYLSEEPERIMPCLVKGFDDSFIERVSPDDIIVAGANFSCGSSRKYSAVGLARAGAGL